MKSKYISIYIFIVTITTMFVSSCTLFIDDDLVGRDLPKYHGNGYDEPVHEESSWYDVTYQYKPTTKTLHTNEDVMHIKTVRRDSADFFHCLVYDLDTPQEELPVVGQCLVSNNLEKFQNGLGDKVVKVQKTAHGYLVLTRHASLEELFKELVLEAVIPTNNNFEDYDYYEYMDGDSVLRTATNKNMARDRMLGKAKVSKAELEFGLPPFDVSIGAKPLNKKFAKVEINGNFSFHTSVYVKIELWETPVVRLTNDLEIGATATLKVGAKAEGSIAKKAMKKFSHKIAGKADFLNGKLKWPVGPVVLVPKFGVNLGIEGELSAFATANLKWKTRFTVGAEEDPGVEDEDSSGPEFNVGGGLAGELDLLVLTVKFGLGAYTNLVSIDAKLKGSGIIQGALDGETDLLSDEIEDTDGEEFESEGDVFTWAFGDENVKIDLNPRIDAIWKTEFGLSAGVDSDQLQEYKQAIDDALLIVEAEQIEGLDFDEDEEDDEYMDSNSIINNLAQRGQQNDDDGVVTAEDMKKFMSEADALREAGVTDGKEAYEKGKKINDIEAQIDVSWVLPFLTWDPIKTWYVFPKMDDKTFRVGRTWNSDQTNLVFTAEYYLEDPGLASFVSDYYPGFLIKQGNKAIMFVLCDTKTPVKYSNYKGRKLSAQLNGLSENVTYTCIPCYASSLTGKPTVFNKGISFSTTTPSISILGLEKNGATAKEKESDNSSSSSSASEVVYTCHFKTYSHVVGSRNCSDWGIMDENDKNVATKYHNSKSAGLVGSGYLQAGQYVHNWTLKSSKPKVKVALTPYAVAKDQSKNDTKNYKYFSTWEETLDFSNDITGLGANSYIGDFSDDSDYILELNSVEFIPSEEGD